MIIRISRVGIVRPRGFFYAIGAIKQYSYGKFNYR